MVSSNLLNKIKDENVTSYLIYAVQLLNLAHDPDKWNAENIELNRRSMLKEIRVVVRNNPKNAYSLEEKIQTMIDEGTEFPVINTELNKLRKYSYSSYIQMNLAAQKTDPKKYHKALQNLIGWNLD